MTELENDERKGKRPGIYVGMPALLHLEEFGELLSRAFGHTPVLVGSSVTTKDWRDVDVRLILPDSEYCALFDVEKVGDHVNRDTHHCPKWVALCMAFSALGAKMTGLPIDFQIQARCLADEQFKGYRHWLFRSTLIY